MNAPETINIEKYAEALNNLIGVDSAYFQGDKDVDAIVELIVAAKKLENRIKELEAENKKLKTENEELCDELTCLEIESNLAVRNAIKKMLDMFEERLDISVCGYSTDEVVSDVLTTLNEVAKEILEGNK